MKVGKRCEWLSKANLLVCLRLLNDLLNFFIHFMHIFIFPTKNVTKNRKANGDTPGFIFATQQHPTDTYAYRKRN